MGGSRVIFFLILGFADLFNAGFYVKCDSVLLGRLGRWVLVGLFRTRSARL